MNRFFHYRVYCCILLFLCTCNSCQLLERKDEGFAFNPAPRKEYSYSLTVTSSGLIRHSANNATADKIIYDTFGLDFSLKNIYDADSIVICKLTFNNFRKKVPEFRVSFSGMSVPDSFLQKNPFAIFDSVGYFIHGLSVQVAISKKGIVKKVDGIDGLIENISNASNENAFHIKMLLADYISVNAIKDLLNRMLSAIPGAIVKKNDRWVRNVTLITKAPVKISNLYTLKQRSRDTAFIDAESIVSAEQSEGGNVYMKGKQSGHAIVGYSTGMPFLYETTQETVTTTSHRYDVIRKEHFLLKRLLPAF